MARTKTLSGSSRRKSVDSRQLHLRSQLQLRFQIDDSSMLHSQRTELDGRNRFLSEKTLRQNESPPARVVIKTESAVSKLVRTYLKKFFSSFADDLSKKFSSTLVALFWKLVLWFVERIGYVYFPEYAPLMSALIKLLETKKVGHDPEKIA